jgi:hypothetical protein
MVDGGGDKGGKKTNQHVLSERERGSNESNREDLE